MLADDHTLVESDSGDGSKVTWIFSYQDGRLDLALVDPKPTDNGGSAATIAITMSAPFTRLP